MSFIKETENYIKKVILSLGYDIDNVSLETSSRKELGEFQINIAMSLAKKYGENPRDIANKIINSFDNRFINTNVAGPGFINVSINEEVLLNNMNKLINNFDLNVDKVETKKKIIVDYGGANAAKALHVGHMRSANIGEALNRLAKLFGNDTISDAHIGDLGRQAGMVISEIKKRFPHLPYFDKNYKGEYPKYHITTEELGIYYPTASNDAKNNEDRMTEVRNISAEVDKGNEPFFTLWKDIVEVSVEDIKKTYDFLNCKFDLWEGEMSSFKYMSETLKFLEPYTYESNGAKVIDVKYDNETQDIPPVLVIKSDGSTIYATREFATLYGRVKEYNPDEIWYITDLRQSLYFKQVFRAAYKTNMVRNDVVLENYGFGTVNGKDGKPFKTRDGGILDLNKLISLVKEEIQSKMTNYDSEEEKDKISDILTTATIKYADLLPFRTTDYIFDIEKFSSFEGKTGPYILYTLVRIKSILNKVENDSMIIKNIHTETEKSIYLKIVELSKVLKKSYEERTLNYICEYLFEICSLFNKFYGECNIVNEQDVNKKDDYIALLHLIHNTVSNILDVLAIKVPDKM